MNNLKLVFISIIFLHISFGLSAASEHKTYETRFKSRDKVMFLVGSCGPSYVPSGKVGEVVIFLGIEKGREWYLVSVEMRHALKEVAVCGCEIVKILP